MVIIIVVVVVEITFSSKMFYVGCILENFIHIRLYLKLNHQKSKIHWNFQEITTLFSFSCYVGFSVYIKNKQICLCMYKGTSRVCSSIAKSSRREGRGYAAVEEKGMSSVSFLLCLTDSLQNIDLAHNRIFCRLRQQTQP